MTTVSFRNVWGQRYIRCVINQLAVRKEWSIILLSNDLISTKKSLNGIQIVIILKNIL
jgi:hypothetical protein